MRTRRTVSDREWHLQTTLCYITMQRSFVGKWPRISLVKIRNCFIEYPPWGLIMIKNKSIKVGSTSMCWTQRQTLRWLRVFPVKQGLRMQNHLWRTISLKSSWSYRNVPLRRPCHDGTRRCCQQLTGICLSKSLSRPKRCQQNTTPVSHDNSAIVCGCKRWHSFYTRKSWRHKHISLTAL